MEKNEETPQPNLCITLLFRAKAKKYGKMCGYKNKDENTT